MFLWDNSCTLYSLIFVIPSIEKSYQQGYKLQIFELKDTPQIGNDQSFPSRLGSDFKNIFLWKTKTHHCHSASNCSFLSNARHLLWLLKVNIDFSDRIISDWRTIEAAQEITHESPDRLFSSDGFSSCFLLEKWRR